MSCPDESAILEHISGALEPETDARIAAHLADCRACREMVALLVKADSKAPTEPAGEVADALSSGTRVGRYLILDALGAGGMSWVYTAYDPSLDRKIALKFLKAAHDAGPDGAARLLREAQAMARLSHPNVVNVYDAGDYRGAVFLAMERIDGQTLKDWLGHQPRPWREVLAAWRQAGQGLAAAHRAGIIHRDIKPDNLLMGADGRARVTDFGLACSDGAASPLDRAELSTEPALSAPLTRTGALLGTPAYMSPEQIDSAPATARSDQFSFCVALHEALYGVRPFSGASLWALGVAIRQGTPATPARGAGVPLWLRRAVLKGLNADPAARHADMTALLRALEPPAWPVRFAAALGLAGVLAAAAGGATYVARAPERECSGGLEQLAGVWDGARAARLEQAFQKAGGPGAAKTAADVSGALAAYATAWTAMRTEACVATKVKREQSAQVLDLRTQCLRERQQELGALVDVLSTSDAEALAKAAGAVRGLTPVGRCADVKALSAPVPLPEDAGLRTAIDAVGQSLAQVKALRAAGRYPEGLIAARAATAAAEKTGYPPSEAEALYLLGVLQAATGDETAADDTFQRTIWMAERAHDDRRRAGGWLGLLFAAASANQPAQARAAAQQVDAILARIGGDDEIEISRLNGLAALEYVQGHYDEALGLHQKMLAIAKRTQRAQGVDVANVLYSIGLDLRGAGRFDEALAQLKASAAMLEAVEGPDHPDLAGAYEGLGTVYKNLRDYPASVKAFERCIAVAEATLGAEHPLLAEYLSSLGDTYSMEGKHADALRVQQRALAIMEKRMPANHPDLVYPLQGVGDAYLHLGQPEKAVSLLERALALRPAGVDFPPDQRASAAYSLAQALWASGGDRARARMLAGEAVAGFAHADSQSKDALAEATEWVARHRR